MQIIFKYTWPLVVIVSACDLNIPKSWLVQDSDVTFFWLHPAHLKPEERAQQKQPRQKCCFLSFKMTKSVLTLMEIVSSCRFIVP